MSMEVEAKYTLVSKVRLFQRMASFRVFWPEEMYLKTGQIRQLSN